MMMLTPLFIIYFVILILFFMGEMTLEKPESATRNGQLKQLVTLATQGTG